MYRSKDFQYMDVFDIKGKRIGFVKDIVLDFHKGNMLGFYVNSYKIFNKNNNVLLKDIVYINKNIVIKRISKGKFLRFKDIKHMDVIDLENNILGILDDLIIDEKTFKITGIIVSTGLLNNFIQGKKIIALDNVILGEENLLYLSNPNNNINLVMKVKNMDYYNQENKNENRK